MTHHTSTYLVTGGAGFIGSHVCNSLIEQGHWVINVDNFDSFYDPEIKQENVKHLLVHPKYRLHRVDIRDKEGLRTIFNTDKIDMVIHLAGMAGVIPSLQDPVLYEEVNIKGTLNVLECMRTFGVKKIIFGSSSSVYGNDERQGKRKEDSDLGQMISPYAITKKAGEDFCKLYHVLYGIDCIALRFFTVFGPRQRPDLAIHKFVKRITRQECIPFYGSGTSLRDYSYVTDIVKGIEQAAHYLEKHPTVFEVINLSGNHAISLTDMVKTIERVLDEKAIIHWLPMQAGDVLVTNGDIGKAEKLLNYRPEIGFEEGIQKFVNWYKSEYCS